MAEQEQASHVATGVFFVGLGVLLISGWWWPGIMFVLAASLFARAKAAGEDWKTATGAFWLLGIGLIFGIPGLIGDLTGAFWQIFPLLLFAIGLFMLFGGKYRPKINGKRKNGDDVHRV